MREMVANVSLNISRSILNPPSERSPGIGYGSKATNKQIFRSTPDNIEQKEINFGLATHPARTFQGDHLRCPVVYGHLRYSQEDIEVKALNGNDTCTLLVDPPLLLRGGT